MDALLNKSIKITQLSLKLIGKIIIDLTFLPSFLAGIQFGIFFNNVNAASFSTLSFKDLTASKSKRFPSLPTDYILPIKHRISF